MFVNGTLIFGRQLSRSNKSQFSSHIKLTFGILVLALALLPSGAAAQESTEEPDHPESWECSSGSPNHPAHVTASCGWTWQQLQKTKACSVANAPHFGGHSGNGGENCKTPGRPCQACQYCCAERVADALCHCDFISAAASLSQSIAAGFGDTIGNLVGGELLDSLFPGAPSVGNVCQRGAINTGQYCAGAQCLANAVTTGDENTCEG